MSALERTPLRVVTDNGELIEDAKLTIQRLQDELAGTAATIRRQSHIIGQLTRDRAAEARAHRAWPDLIGLHDLWRELTNRPGSQWDEECFWAALPFFKKYGPALCEAAIHGAAFDHFAYDLKNGERHHCNEWTRIFSPRRKQFGSPVYGKDNFEGFARRAPAAVKDALVASGDFARLRDTTEKQSVEAAGERAARRKPESPTPGGAGLSHNRNGDQQTLMCPEGPTARGTGAA